MDGAGEEREGLSEGPGKWATGARRRKSGPYILYVSDELMSQSQNGRPLVRL